MVEVEAQVRYAWIDRVLHRVLTRLGPRRESRTEAIDRVLTHPVVGLAVLLLLLAMCFQAVYSWASPVMNLFDAAFAAMARDRAEALLVANSAIFLVHATKVAALALKGRLPTMFSYRENVEAGGLMAYAINMSDFIGRAASYVDRILKGAKPAELPVEQPTKFELVINLKTAKALGLTIPPPVLARADAVIQ